MSLCVHNMKHWLYKGGEGATKRVESELIQKVCGGFPPFMFPPWRTRCAELCVLYELRGTLSWLVFWGSSYGKRVCVCVHPPSLRFRWTEQTSTSVEVHLGVHPPSGLKPCVLAFLLSFFSVLAFVNPPLVSLNGMVLFLQIDFAQCQTICRLTSLQVFLEQAASVILSMVPVGLCCPSLDWIGRRVCWNLDQCLEKK